MNDKQMAYLANCLIQYHKNSFKIRAHNIVSGGTVTLPIVVELGNFRDRLLNNYTQVDRMSQAAALNDILTRGKKDIQNLVVEARTSQDPNIQLKQAKEIKSQMEAAQEMLEKISG